MTQKPMTYGIALTIVTGVVMITRGLQMIFLPGIALVGVGIGIGFVVNPTSH